jgi:hypothetical protein
MGFFSEALSMAQGLGSSLKLVIAVALGIVWLGSYVVILGLLYKNPAPMPPVSTSPAQTVPSEHAGQGGMGGDAKVLGSGVAIGGPGGASGKAGAGGTGGSAEVHGDGHAAGGAGGSVSDEGVWRAPAKSGYEVHQRALGLPVDPAMRQFGRGGAAPGYEPKLQVVQQLRETYFREHRRKPQSIFENIGAVPLDYLNQALAVGNEIWRVRIVDGDEYEFYIPGH